jgi:hypothetical protein
MVSGVASRSNASSAQHDAHKKEKPTCFELIAAESRHDGTMWLLHNGMETVHGACIAFASFKVPTTRKTYRADVSAIALEDLASASDLESAVSG